MFTHRAISLSFQGNLTSPQAVEHMAEAMQGEMEKRVDILLYKKSGRCNGASKNQGKGKINE